MQLRELLLRKIRDYELTYTQLSIEIGCREGYISALLSDAGALSIDTRIRARLCRALDIAPDVLDASIAESLRARYGR